MAESNKLSQIIRQIFETSRRIKERLERVSERARARERGGRDKQID